MENRKLIEHYNQLKSERGTWENSWQELANNFAPRLAYFYQKRTPGERKEQTYIYDAYPPHALMLLANGLHALLTNNAVKWFYLKAADPLENSSVYFKEWLESAETILRDYLEDSNLTTQIYEAYYYLCLFGTACLYSEWSYQGHLYFENIHLKDVLLEADQYRNINRAFRTISLSTFDIVKRFGLEKVSDSVKDNYIECKNPNVEVLHIVFPSDMYRLYGIDKVYSSPMAFTSVYVEKETATVLSFGGYHEFPFITPRWSVSPDEIYGRGPAFNALPDTKGLYSMMKTMLGAGEKSVDPPLMVPDQLLTGPLRLSPKSINYIRSGVGSIEPLFVNHGLPYGNDLINLKRMQITQIFFNDQLQMFQDVRMTATEVIQRTEEKMRILAPVLGRLQKELLKPLIERCFLLLLRNKKIPEMPPELAQPGIKIEYSSPIARAQRFQEVRSISNFTEFIVPFAQADPNVLKFFDFKKLFSLVAEVLGVPQSVLSKNGGNEGGSGERSPESSSLSSQEMSEFDQIKSLLGGQSV